MLERVPHGTTFGLVDSFPIPVCQFARARRCRRFRGEAACGKDLVARQTFYGFRLHVRLCWPGLLGRCLLAPGNSSERAVVAQLAEHTRGVLLGDRHYDAPRAAPELATRGVRLIAPYRFTSRDPHPTWSVLLSHPRYRIGTVFGQLVERYHAKRVWARDSWHLRSRLLREVLGHTLAVLLNEHRPTRLQLAGPLSP